MWFLEISEAVNTALDNALFYASAPKFGGINRVK
jgi:hypothetical protein